MRKEREEGERGAGEGRQQEGAVVGTLGTMEKESMGSRRTGTGRDFDRGVH